MSGTVFITGATGFVGRHLVPRLAGQVGTLRCLVRRTSDTRALEKAGVDLVYGDVGDAAAVRAGMEGCDRIVHLASIYSFWERDPGVYHRVNVEGARTVMAAALEAEVDAFVQVSSVVVFGRPDRTPFDENTPVGPRRFSQYARTKYEADLVAEELGARGLPVVFVYPGAVLGPGDPKATGQYIADVVFGRMPVALFSGSHLTFVHVRDVAEAITRILSREITSGDRYIVAGEQVSLAKLNAMIADIAGVRQPWPPVPDWMGMLSAALLTAISRLVRRPPPWGLSLDMARTSRAGFRADGSKAVRELGLEYTPVRIAVEEAIRELGQA